MTISLFINDFKFIFSILFIVLIISNSLSQSRTISQEEASRRMSNGFSKVELTIDHQRSPKIFHSENRTLKEKIYTKKQLKILWDFII